MANEFELGGRKFKIGKLNTFKQFHIVRRIAPILADLLPVLGDVQKATKGKVNDEDFETIAKFLAPAISGVSKLSDQDAEFVLLGLCSCIEMQLGPSWTRVATDNMLMVQDLDLPSLLQLASRSFMANLSSFFALLPAASPGAR